MSNNSLFNGVVQQMNQLNIHTIGVLRQNDDPIPVDLEEVLITPVEWKMRDGKMIFPKVIYTYYRKGSVWSLLLERISGNEPPKWGVDLYGSDVSATNQPDLKETLRMLNFLTKLVKATPAN